MFHKDIFITYSDKWIEKFFQFRHDVGETILRFYRVSGDLDVNVKVFVQMGVLRIATVSRLILLHI